jgi:hypothetical protein
MIWHVLCTVTPESYGGERQQGLRTDLGNLPNLAHHNLGYITHHD